MAQETPELVGQWGGVIRCVRVREPYLYLNFGTKLVVLDVSVPQKPRQAGSLLMAVSWIGDIRIHGSYAYVTVLFDDYPRGGFYIVDISSPANLKTTGFFSTYHGISDLVVEGGHAYLAAQDDGLLIVDISDLANPQTACTLKIPPRDDWSASRVWSVEVSGQYAYLGASGFHVIDISDPLRPQPAGYCEMLEGPDAIRVHGRHAYCATSDGLVVIDVSDPAAPTIVTSYGTYAEMGFVQDMALVGDRVFVIGESESSTGCLDVLDISHPEQPKRIARSNHPGPSVAVSGSHVFAASIWGGLRILELTPDGILTEVGRTIEPRMAGPLLIAQRLAYICTREGFCIADVSDPAHIAGVSFFSDNRAVWEMVVAEPYAYLIEGPPLPDEIGMDGMGGGLCVVDISDPAAPRKASFIELPTDEFELALPGHPSDLVVRDGRAYVLWAMLDYHKGLESSENILVVDVSRPDAPAQIGSYPVPRDVETIEIDGIRFSAHWSPTGAMESETERRLVCFPPTPAAGPEHQQASRGRAERDGIIYKAKGSEGVMMYRQAPYEPRT